jgi:hypothetical protein
MPLQHILPSLHRLSIPLAYQIPLAVAVVGKNQFDARIHTYMYVRLVDCVQQIKIRAPAATFDGIFIADCE